METVVDVHIVLPDLAQIEEQPFHEALLLAVIGYAFKQRTGGVKHRLVIGDRLQLLYHRHRQIPQRSALSRMPIAFSFQP